MPATFTVTNLNDAGPGSLRQAIQEANNNGNGEVTDAIVFQPGLTGTLTLTSGQLNVTQRVAINGPGSAKLTVSGNNASRVFLVDNGSTAVDDFAISGMRLTGGVATGIPVGGGIHLGSESLVLQDVIVSGNAATRGGGIYVNPNGRLTLENSEVSLNTTTSNDGAGIFLSSGSFANLRNSNISGNTATEDGNSAGGGGVHVQGGAFLTVAGSIISGNQAPANAGGILVRPGGTLVVRDSTISGNKTNGYGGGLQLDRAASVTVENSTISGNESVFQGGGIWMTGTTAVVRNSTIAFNHGGKFFAVSAGGGVMLDEQAGPPSTLTLQGTIVAQNQRGVPAGQFDDILGTVSAASANNLIGDGTGLAGLTPGVNLNQIGTAAVPIDPLLSPLGFNGGPTLTHALRPGSPAIDAGFNFAGTAADQRGGTFARRVGVATDIGAFEVQPPPPAPTPAPPPAAPTVEVQTQRVGGRTRVDVMVNGALRRRFFPFKGFTGRVQVQRVDVNGDGLLDVVARATVHGKTRTRTFTV